MQTEANNDETMVLHALMNRIEIASRLGAYRLRDKAKNLLLAYHLNQITSHEVMEELEDVSCVSMM